jgi:hypothetical protein
VDKKLEIVPQEADLVRRIFALYIELGSVGALARALDGLGVKPKPRQLANGQSKAAERYTIGPLAHMLKNRFYVGEVAYRGEVHKGEHPAIVDREVFDRVQTMLTERTVTRTLKRANSPHLLTGLIFDDRGNPMSPTHANKKGVRYRYYTSHAVLQHCKEEAGSVPRVSAPDVEELVCECLRRGRAAEPGSSDKDLVTQNVVKVTIRRDRIEVVRNNQSEDEQGIASKFSIPFTSTATARKGIVRDPSEHLHIDAVTRETLLQAIARAARWSDEIRSGKVGSLDEIAIAEQIGERHIRRLLPLAFLAPRIIEAISDGIAPAGLTVSRMTEALPHGWADQEKMF